MITLTIIIPCFNRADYAEELAQSIPDREDIEILWIDDHSTKPCFPKRHFTKASSYLIQQEDGKKGPGDARNIGIKRAKGDWIIFADDDDLLLDIEQFIECLKSQNSELVISYPTSFRPDGSIGTRHLSYAWLHHIGMKGNTDAHWRYHSPTSKAFSTKFLRTHNLYFPKGFISEDSLFNAELSACNPVISYWKDPIYRIREGQSGLSHNLTNDKIKARMQAIQMYNDILCKNSKNHLQIGLMPDIMKLAKKSKSQVIKEIIQSIKKGHRLLPTFWTIKNALRRKIKKI